MSFLWCPHCKQPHALSTTSCPTTGGRISMGIGRAERALAERGTLIAKRYKVRTFVGSESVALVYVATHVTTGRQVLVKVVHDDDDLSREERVAEVLEMEREARAASMVEHPNVAPMLDFERTRRGRRLSGARAHRRPSWRTLSANDGALDPADASDILSQILSGLHALDLAGIVHRDLATHNIFVQQRAGCRPLVKIAGLGRSTGPNLGTTNGSPVGHPLRVARAPRQPPGAVDHRSDLFSCGVILFEMLTGRRPFEAATTERCGPRSCTTRLPPPRSSAAARGRVAGAPRQGSRQGSGEAIPDARELQRALPSRTRPTSAPAAALRHRRADRAHRDAFPSPRGRAAGRGANMGFEMRPVHRARDRQRLRARDAARHRHRRRGLQGDPHAPPPSGRREDPPRPTPHRRSSTSSGSRRRLSLASKLDHPNVTRVLDCGEESDGRLSPGDGVPRRAEPRGRARRRAAAVADSRGHDRHPDR